MLAIDMIKLLIREDINILLCIALTIRHVLYLIYLPPEIGRHQSSTALLSEELRLRTERNDQNQYIIHFLNIPFSLIGRKLTFQV